MNIKVLRNVLEANDQIAGRIRERLAAHKVAAINLISAPGAGKTSLLERTIPTLKRHVRIAVLEGDSAGTHDAERIGKLDVPVTQLITGGACHLEATLVERGLGELDLDSLDLVFIENVGPSFFLSGGFFIWTPLFGILGAFLLTMIDNTVVFATLGIFDKIPTSPSAALRISIMQSLINAAAGMFIRPPHAD